MKFADCKFQESDDQRQQRKGYFEESKSLIGNRMKWFDRVAKGSKEQGQIAWGSRSKIPR